MITSPEAKQAAEWHYKRKLKKDETWHTEFCEGYDAATAKLREGREWLVPEWALEFYSESPGPKIRVREVRE